MAGVAGYELRVAGYGLRVTSCGLRVASYGLPFDPSTWFDSFDFTQDRFAHHRLLRISATLQVCFGLAFGLTELGPSTMLRMLANGLAVLGVSPARGWFDGD